MRRERKALLIAILETSLVVFILGGCERINNLFLPVDPREVLFVNESPRYTVYVFLDKPYVDNPRIGEESFILRPFGRKEIVFEDFGRYTFWYWFDYQTRIGTYQVIVPPFSFDVDFETLTHYHPNDEEWGEVIQFFPERYLPDHLFILY